MRSKCRRRVLFFVFSAIIMVGLMIGVFADYNTNDYYLGEYYYFEPYNCGDLYLNVYSYNQTILPGYYYMKFVINELPDNDINVVDVDNVHIVYTTDNTLVVMYDLTHTSETVSIPFESDVIYLFVRVDVQYNTLKYDSDNIINDSKYIEVSYYSLVDNSINIYDNSQDAWASVVSVVTDATDSIINNDLLLLFAAAVPVISFGVGFLIRLKFRG